MNNTAKLLIFSSFIFLSGCVGSHASYSDTLQDKFLFTSAEDVSSAEMKCIALNQSFTFQSGDFTFIVPAGRYEGKKRHDTGVFYYAPTPITLSNHLTPLDRDGIYLDNQFNKGNLFGGSPTGWDNRPIRGVVLPQTIFPFIKQVAC